MINNAYEVTKEDFLTFFDQIKEEVIEKVDIGYFTFYNSNVSENIFGAVEHRKEAAPHFYAIDPPLDEERRPPTAIRQIVLNTKEEVQELLNALSAIGKEKKND